MRFCPVFALCCITQKTAIFAPPSLKIPRSNIRAGSSPASGTKKRTLIKRSFFVISFYPFLWINALILRHAVRLKILPFELLWRKVKNEKHSLIISYFVYNDFFFFYSYGLIINGKLYCVSVQMVCYDIII